MSSPDLKNNDAESSTVHPPAGTNAGPGDDPLAHLHKMSTTAGLGSGDYVAVNGTAVFALLLGLASAFTMMDRVFLVIPLAGIVAAIVAWRQIDESNGTQTGKPLVIIAILASLGFGGYVFAKQVIEYVQHREDRTAISKIVVGVGEKIKAGEIDALYKTTTDRFRGVFPPERFHSTMNQIRENQVLGKLKETKWNGLVEFQKDDATGAQFAVTGMQFDFEKAQGGLRENPVLRKVNGIWQIDQMPELFQAPSRQE